MYLEQLQSAYENGDTEVVFNGTEYAALQDEVAAAPLDDYDAGEFAAYRWKGSLAIGVDYSKG